MGSTRRDEELQAVVFEQLGDSNNDELWLQSVSDQFNDVEPNDAVPVVPAIDYTEDLGLEYLEWQVTAMSEELELADPLEEEIVSIENNEEIPSGESDNVPEMGEPALTFIDDMRQFVRWVNNSGAEEDQPINVEAFVSECRQNMLGPIVEIPVIRVNVEEVVDDFNQSTPGPVIAKMPAPVDMSRVANAIQANPEALSVALKEPVPKGVQLAINKMKAKLEVKNEDLDAKNAREQNLKMGRKRRKIIRQRMKEKNLLQQPESMPIEMQEDLNAMRKGNMTKENTSRVITSIKEREQEREEERKRAEERKESELIKSQTKIVNKPSTYTAKFFPTTVGEAINWFCSGKAAKEVPPVNDVPQMASSLLMRAKQGCVSVEAPASSDEQSVSTRQSKRRRRT